MSVIALTDFINCANKDLSVEALFKGLIASSSTGTLYLRTDAGIYAAANTLSLTFTNADLVNVTIGGVVHQCLLVTHNFATNSYDYIVKDNIGNGIIAAQSVINTNSTYIIIDDTITGTWTIDLWTV
jgi:hypothetical protein